MSFTRPSDEFTAAMTRITETAKLGGPHLRSAHAMEKRLSAKVKLAALDAGIQLQHPWMRVQDIVADIRQAEDATAIERVARLIQAGQNEREAAELEAKGGPRRLQKAERLREYARIDRMIVEKWVPCTGCHGPLLPPDMSAEKRGLCADCRAKMPPPANPVEQTAHRTDRLLAFYTNSLNGGDPGDDQTTLTDILADLMIWASVTPSPQALDFERALNSARGHYAAEKTPAACTTPDGRHLYSESRCVVCDGVSPGLQAYRG